MSDDSVSMTIGPSPQVRPARPEDLDGVMRLTEAVAAEGRWIGRELPLNLELSTRRFLDGIAEADQLSLVAEASDADGARVIGQLHLGVAPYGVADLGMLIDAPWRGQGLGRALLQAAVDWSRARPDVHKIALQVWPHNEAAIGLYTAFGFEREGYLRAHYRRRNGDLWDAVVMGLQLTDTPT